MTLNAFTAIFLAFGLSTPAMADTSAIQQAVAAAGRSPANIARDHIRHPAAELAFFGVTPRATVVEVWPGGGYWTQILGPLLHDRGTYYAALGTPDGNETEREYALSPQFRAMLDASPDSYGRIKLRQFGQDHLDLAPAGSADVVLTFRNLHNWMEANDAAAMLAALHRALKPGGTLGIEDHRANASMPVDTAARDGYVNQDYAIHMVEKAGFTFAGSSEINANPRDTTDWPKGVWTLPPTLALGQTERQKYLAVGEADNFVLKFTRNR